MSANFKIRTRTLEEYQRVMSLKKKGVGQIKLARIAGISQHTIHDWLYLGAKPKRLRKIKLLPLKAKELTPELGYILGVIESDGCLCKSKRNESRGENFDYALILGVTDKDFADFFTQQVEKWCDYKPYTSVTPPRGMGTKDVYWVRLRSKDAYEFLNSFDLNQLKKAPKEVKSMFLRGFFDGDGSVCKAIHIGVTNKETITLANRLLKSLGIKSGHIHTKPTIFGTPFHHFIIASAKSLQRFQEKVGFSIKRKQDRLVALVQSKSHILKQKP
jgi:intein-encoded DNA endonuclease-like protein